MSISPIFLDLFVGNSGSKEFSIDLLTLDFKPPEGSLSHIWDAQPSRLNMNPASCVFLGTLLNLSKPQFFHLEVRDSSTSLVGFDMRVKDKICFCGT